MNLLSPAEFVESYAALGEKKAKASIGRLFLSAMLAGLLIGFGGAVTNTATHAMTNVGLIRMVSGLLFPFGLIMVVLTGAELFTGNCLMAISALERRATVPGVLRNLAIVYVGNLAGALPLAAGCVYFGQMDYSAGGLAVFAIKLAAAKSALPFGSALVLGFFCNVLVCAAVMMALCAKDAAGRAVGAYVPIAVFVLCGFEHCVANMFYIPAGLFALTVPRYAALAAQAGVDAAALTWAGFLLRNLLPVTVGNLLGGFAFAAVIWACHRKINHN